MNKEKELIEALAKVIAEASRQAIVINSISLSTHWLDIGEVPPEKLLGIKIE